MEYSESLIPVAIVKGCPTWLPLLEPLLSHRVLTDYTETLDCRARSCLAYQLQWPAFLPAPRQQIRQQQLGGLASC